MRSWFGLVKKEIKSMMFSILVIFLLVTAWEVYLLTKVNEWPLGLTFGLGFVPFGIFPLIMLVMGYLSFRSEWKNNTIYLLRTLPRKGYELVSAKLVSSSLIYIFITVYTFGLHMFFHWSQIKYLRGHLPEAVNQSYSNRMVVLVVIAYIVIGIIPYIISQFSYLVSCYFDKFRWLVSIVVFVLSHYILVRMGGFIARLFAWMPDIPIDAMTSTPYGERLYTIYLGSGPVIAAFVILTAFFFTGSWILKNQIDV